MRFTFVSLPKALSVFVSVIQLFRDTLHGCIESHICTEVCANGCQSVRGMKHLIDDSNIDASDGTTVGNLIDIPTENAYTYIECGSLEILFPGALYSSRHSSGVEILLTTFCVHFCLRCALAEPNEHKKVVVYASAAKQYCF